MFTKTQKDLYIVIVLLITTIFLSFFSIKYLPSYVTGDSDQYINIASHLIKDGSYIISDGHLLSPGYPVFLAIIFLTFGEQNNTIYFIHFIILGGISVLTYFIAKDLTISRKKAFVASLFIIFWPYFILYSKSLLTEILFSFFLITSVYFLIKTINNSKIFYSVLSGFLLGVATLIRPVILFLPFFIFAVFLIQKIFIAIKEKKIIAISTHPKYFINLIIFILTFLFAISPWIIYASHKMGYFTPISSTSKRVLAKSNSYEYEYNCYHTPGYEPESQIKVEKIIQSKIKNIFRFWKSGAAGTHADDIIKQYPITKYLIWFYKIIYYCLLIFMFFGIKSVKSNNSTLVMYSVILYFWFFQSLVFFPYPRYTLPIIPLMIVLAFFSFFQFFENMKKPKNKNASQTQTKNL